MRLSASFRAWVRTVLFVAPLLPAHALVKFNDARDEIFVTGAVGIGYDSNIFGYNGGDSDTTYNASLDLEYARNAGMLGVNAGLGWDFAKFQEFSSEDYANPHARAELTKNSGRTTGAVSAAVKRDSRADSVVNLRTTSWDYDAGLNLKYPVIERYSVTGEATWRRRDFQDNAALVDLNTWSIGSDIFYTYNSQRDFFGGYRLRVTDTTADTQDVDHNLSIGTSGKIIPTINGSARIGYQRRESSRTDGTRESFDGFSSTVSARWSGLSRLNITGSLSSDFDTIATDVSVTTTSAGLDAQYAFTARFSAFAGAGVGYTRFLGVRGGDRRDTYFSWNAGVAYTLSDRFKASLTYGHFKNWSTLAFSDYARNTISLNLSSRW